MNDVNDNVIGPEQASKDDLEGRFVRGPSTMTRTTFLLPIGETCFHERELYVSVARGLVKGLVLSS